jgi:hypothetical protein
VDQPFRRLRPARQNDHIAAAPIAAAKPLEQSRHAKRGLVEHDQVYVPDVDADLEGGCRNQHQRLIRTRSSLRALALWTSEAPMVCHNIVSDRFE